MATKIKKVTYGPLTANEKAEDGTVLAPGVDFVGPEGSMGRFTVSELPGMSAKLFDQLAKACPIAIRMIVHAASQKVGDSYAGVGEEENPLAAAATAIKETLAQIAKAEWRVTSAGGPRATLLARALARVTGQSLEDSVGVVDNLTDEAKKALRADDRIKSATATIKLEEQAAQREKLEKQAKAAPGEAKVDLGKLFTAEQEVRAG